MHRPASPTPPNPQVNSGDELVATEIIFGGTLAELEPEEAVALLSALVFQASLGQVLWTNFHLQCVIQLQP